MKNGSIEIEGDRIDGRTTRSEFLASHRTARLMIENGEHRTYNLGPVDMRGRRMFLNLAFDGEALRQVTLAEANDRGWNVLASDQSLRDDKQRNDEWLTAAYGISSDKLTADWGRLESVVDRKTGESSIILSFNTER